MYFVSHHQSTLIYSEEQLCCDQPKSLACMLRAVPEVNLWGGGGWTAKNFFPVDGGTFHN